MHTTHIHTAGDLLIRRHTEPLTMDEAAAAVAECAHRLDDRHGVVLGSNYDYPGRYSRHDIAFSDPPVMLTSQGRCFRLRALNARGEVLIDLLAPFIDACPAVFDTHTRASSIFGRLCAVSPVEDERMRTRRPSIVDVVRAIRDALASDADNHLGLYGAFAYDLGSQFEPIEPSLPRAADARDVVLYLPEELIIIDRQLGVAERRHYEFASRTDPALDTRDQYGDGPGSPFVPASDTDETMASDHAKGEFAAGVRRALEAFKNGDLFEVVLSQTFSRPNATPPSELYERLRTLNPSPYGFLMNLGDGEHLVGASPEMFVRVRGRRVETCPIAGTVARGEDAHEDAARIRALLNDGKEESELTMCTDVDRNDKARICVPGSVRVIGRRQIELYAKLIHTVDHVEGTLREDMDALDALLAHTWAVTVTGAPKPDAMQFIEDHERTARRYYSGAVGVVRFDGSLSTGLVLRTMRLAGGRAEVRAGATLLHASDPDREEAECRLKASALFEVLEGPVETEEPTPGHEPLPASEGPRVLLLDHRDSFVHTLGDYLRQTGARLTTLRVHANGEGYAGPLDDFDQVVLSPGPGRPEDFGVARTVARCVDAGVPVFGVCLGLQGVVEHFGGRLGVLDTPAHGEAAMVTPTGGTLFGGFPPRFGAARYHSLYATEVPDCLRVTARTEEGLVMAVEHTTLPISAVQFHPESILTSRALGLRLLRNALGSGVDEARSSPTGVALSA